MRANRGELFIGAMTFSMVLILGLSVAVTPTKAQVARVESLNNNRSKKCLDYKTPLEVASSFVALRA